MEYYEIFGHVCTLKDEEDLLQKHLIGRSKFKKFIIKWTTIDPQSFVATEFFNSHSSVVNEMKSHLENHPMTIHPYSRFKFIWEFFMATIFLVGLIYVPLQYMDYVDDNLENDFGNVMIMEAVKISCMVDMVMRFFMGFEKNYEIILDKKQIAREYLRGLFVFDLLTNIPFFVGLAFQLGPNDMESHFIKITTLLRICRLSTFIKYCQRGLSRFQMSDEFLDIFQLLMYWIICIHWTACLHILPGIVVGKFQKNVKVNAWFENEIFYKHDPLGKYVICLFKSIKTVMGTGYVKELQPKMYFDKIYASVLTIVGRVSLYITLASIYRLIQGVRSSTLRYDEMMVQLNKYTSCNRLPKSTKMKLKSNYDYMFCKNYFNEQEILKTISVSLRQEIMVHNTRQLVENSPFFENLPSYLVMRIISVLSMELFFEGDVIYAVGEMGTSVYFITSGSVALYSSSDKEVCHFTDGDYFGEMSFISDEYKYRFCKAVALEMTECYKLRKEDFQNLLISYPDLLQKVEALALERMENVMMIEEYENSPKYTGYESINQKRYFSSD
ncbi:unnamed protein product [Chironomus riparius]|uniref:Cyclic nucleotide-binding domain-containing protein n=1 Tax=Chironomus riparius TaxID=315576 RepID=A0A9N9WLQ5_9DIPT|nr:unnamed protein product [Chironomus riparius]